MIKAIFLLCYISLINLLNSLDVPLLEIQGIEPNGGPVYGDTRVLVRIKDFNRDLIDDYDRPKCRFGNNHNLVNATYVFCTPYPRKVGTNEPTPEERNETCIQCETSPAHEPDIIPFAVSLLGDFSDSRNSVPYRYYKEPVIDYIYPRYGKKDGGTFIEVFGKNFLNFDQNLRCAFGSKEVKGYYVSDSYMICYSPFSDVVQKELPFSISLNNQQNTRQNVDYIYYDFPQVSRLEPNKGPDTGGTEVHIRGQYFDPTRNATFHNFNDTFCKFGNLSLTTAKVISSTEIVCSSPPSYELREVPVEITLNNREWTRDNILFHYYHPPFIYGISPKIGPVSGGTVVVITGSNFENTGFVNCKFGDIHVKGSYISENELRCVSPRVERPGYVNLYVAIRPNEYSSGINTKYLYYDTPVVSKIDPMCGPESGYTQITIYGKNFANTGSDFVKCVWDQNIKTNATVISDTQIKCDSPSVLDYEGKNYKNITEYDVEITLNNKDLNGPKHKFYYYKDTYIAGLDPIFGPKSGNTIVNITGQDFTQKGACNVTVRVGTYHVKPDVVEKNFMTFRTPQANYTGSTTVQVALNGRQFDKDIIIHNRDIENTYYYYRGPLVRIMEPIKGPTNGKNTVNFLGVGFDEVFFLINNVQERKLYYKFIDASNNNIQYGKTNSTIVSSSHMLQVVTPQVYKNNTKAVVYFSLNNQDFDIYNKDLIYTFYILPNITDISPRYGPLKSENQKIEVTLDNYICTDDCEKIKCRFKSKTNTYYMKANYERPNLVSCNTPNVNIPEAYTIEVSFNGDDYTSNEKTFTFYDPYVIKVVPQMVSSKGNTIINIYGFGFADSGDNLKAQFGSSDNRLKCKDSSCIVKAKYISDENIQAVTYPMKDVYQAETGNNIEFSKFAVEASVYNNDFTQNGVSIFYFDEPDIIEDIFTTDVPMNATDKEIIGNALIHSIPANLDTVVLIPIDSRKINKYYEQFKEFANYTCKYTSQTNDIKIVPGVITSFPQNSGLNNIYICQSPMWDKVGKATIRISMNGYDYSDSKYDITFTDPINIYSVQPPCGPRRGGTKVKIIGSGLKISNDYSLKWGVQSLISMSDVKLLKTHKKDSLKSLRILSNYPLEEIEVIAPQASNKDFTLGGPDYISYSKRNYFPLDDYISKHFTSKFYHSNYEYYYYHQPYVQSFSPHGSIVKGGTTVLVVGAWFDYKPEYGVKPYCKFGNKIVEGVFLSTVRISCVAPEYDKENIRVPFEVSLNRQDFTNSGLLFTYYSDWTKAKFTKIVPQSGPSTGGTNIKVYGTSITSLLNEDEFLCQFNPKDKRMEPKTVPAGFQDFGNNETAVVCNTPGGWTSGTVADIKITFDGQNFFDTGFDFYFYKVSHLLPSSGPTKGNGPIQVVGSGFKNSTKVKCSLNKVEYKPIDIYEDRILCPMPQASYGKNFTGAVDFAVTLNGIDWKTFSNGFYYYIQPEVFDSFPHTGPSKGNALVKIFGSGFRSDFPGANPGCKAGDYYGKGKVISDKEINCNFLSMPLSQNKKPLNVTVALNSYSYSQEMKHLNFTPYGVSLITPSSGPKEGSTRIEVKGAGFYDSKHIRCRFGVPGWYGYTEGQFIDYNRVICNSPVNFNIPPESKYPFSLPFSIAFNEDEFYPWTDTPHYFTIYNQPSILKVTPNEGKTSLTTEVSLYSAINYPFSMPSASIEDTEYLDYSKSAKGELIQKKSISYQPISCRFGRFGVTEGKYYNRTLIKCLTPTIQDDSDIGYEEVPVEIALNGVDYVSNDDEMFTFIGPNAGRMIWVYILIILFMLLLLILLIALISTYWNSSILTAERDVRTANEPHVINKRPKYNKFRIEGLKDNING